MKRLLIFCLLSTAAVPCFAQKIQVGRNWNVSVSFVMGAQVLDAASSRGAYELNPLLGRGPFGSRQVMTKGAIVGSLILSEWLVMRKRPETRRAWAYTNYAIAGATTGIAVRNWRIR